MRRKYIAIVFLIQSVHLSLLEKSFLNIPLMPLGFLASSISFCLASRRAFLRASSSIDVFDSRREDSPFDRSLSWSLGRSRSPSFRERVLRELSLLTEPFTEPSASRLRRRLLRASSSPVLDLASDLASDLSTSESFGVRVSSVPEPLADAGGVGSARCEDGGRFRDDVSGFWLE